MTPRSCPLNTDAQLHQYTQQAHTFTGGGGGGGGGGVWVEGEREEAGAAQLIVTKIGGTVKVQ